MANLVRSIADSVTKLGVKAAYGDPQEIDGTTLVPVALVGFGFGGGAGPDAGENAGEGGGGGGYTIPVGAYVGDSLGVRFQPNPIALLAVAIPFTWVAGKALARVIRALKR